ncbi:MAG TPA: sigma-70 family RNA polymerase sigma factor [Ktedonobacteraceae bacterium]|nr:sigma-70 family RNA polymerase sigma factor [Ktedonobacteraceae bacterium]
MYGNETATGGGPDGDRSQARTYLQQFLQENAASLQNILCGYVASMKLASGTNIEVLAAEVFQDAVIETLAHSDRFNPAMQPRAWFLAIAANILKRHRVKLAKRYRFEVLVGDLASKSKSGNEQDMLDRLMSYTGSAPGPERALLAREGVREILSLVSAEDAHLLNLTLVQGWNAEMLAQMMGVTTGTARVRVHRALTRLRVAWQKAEARKEQGQRNG